ncbi:uncharacterized protein BXZ73DRAFT_95507 [Epithele typhae]|uniref:uncharacterized protein n=1 Tax=Epithele typhae TaxID=378194 RepID=UPI00200847A7|nr:uncharacterized protein BXZ73DRAFT_95507 [Epithele typhae]KAH9945995.1 hypothetical protein BXZ73DRAFT_95507 [Epithele typhae]
MPTGERSFLARHLLAASSSVTSTSPLAVRQLPHRSSLCPSSTLAPRSLLFAAACHLVSAACFLFSALLILRTIYTSAHPPTARLDLAMAPSAQGWHARATPLPTADASGFAPTADALAFVVLLNAPADPEGFTMALFRPDVAVDARGRALRLQADDAVALLALAERANAMPDTGSFMNAWRVAHPRTSQKIDRLFVRTPEGRFRETSVQGWDPVLKQLKTAVGEYEELPPVLYEFFGYVQEARDGFQKLEANQDIITQVTALATS